jgi:hypothetical protein
MKTKKHINKIGRNLRTRKFKTHKHKTRKHKTRKFKTRKYKILKRMKGGVYSKLGNLYEEPDKNIVPNYNKLGRINRNITVDPIYDVNRGNSGNNKYSNVPINFDLFEKANKNNENLDAIPKSNTNTPPPPPPRPSLYSKMLSAKMNSQSLYNSRLSANSANMNNSNNSPIYADDTQSIIEKRKIEKERVREEEKKLWENVKYENQNWFKKLYKGKNKKIVEKDEKERKRKEHNEMMKNAINSKNSK